MKNTSFKISVIVPIYGVEKYIERCARSLFEQTLDNIEYIFVDDCTQDNSVSVLLKVLDNYPHRRDQVTILKHEYNKGLPQARKTGVLIANGEYIAHCDSDDWVSKDMYQIMYEKAKKEDWDIAWCDFFLSDGNSKSIVKAGAQLSLMTGPVWNKIVKRSIYLGNEIIYPTSNKAEDGALMAQLSFFSKTRGYIDTPLYYYFQNPESMCRVRTVESCLARYKQDCDNTNLRIEFLKKHNALDDYKSDVLIWKCVARDELLPLINKKEYYMLWYNTYPEINKEYLLDSGIPLRKKVGFLARLFRLYKRNIRIE